MTHHTVGIDISKARLDAYAAPLAKAASFANDTAGFRKLIVWMGPEVGRVAYEPTGPWHRDFEEALLKAGLPLYAINPYQVRCFARSLGARAKTDAVDARTLAVMAAAVDDLRPHPGQIPKPARPHRTAAGARRADRGPDGYPQPGQELAPSSGQGDPRQSAGRDRTPSEGCRRRDPEAAPK